jgi:patatin-like phospholipase/acyl hydrolase
MNTTRQPVNEVVSGHAAPRFQILALSGGGYRGLYTAQVLELLEQQIKGRKLYECFDLIAGTSIGGIIAIGIALGTPAEKIRAEIENRGPTIFCSQTGILNSFKRGLKKVTQIFAPKYSNAPLRETIEAIVGQETPLEAAKRPLVVPAVALTAGADQLFRTPHHPAHDAQRSTRLVDIALATAAAPTYFPAARIGDADYADGGIIANAPDAVALHEAEAMLRKERQDIFVLSVGTTTASVALAAGGNPAGGVLWWTSGKYFLEVTMAAQQTLATRLVAEAISDRYLQVNETPSPNESKFLALDGASEQATKTLKEMAKRSVERIKSAGLNQVLAHQSSFAGWHDKL